MRLSCLYRTSEFFECFLVPRALVFFFSLPFDRIVRDVLFEPGGDFVTLPCPFNKLFTYGLLMLADGSNDWD